MKRGKKLITAGLTFFVAAGILCGCGAANGTTAASQVHTITFYNGDTELGTAEAADGQVLDKASYEEFENQKDLKLIAWYGTKNFMDASQINLESNTFSEDTNIYGKFQSENLTADTRSWYLVGQSDGGSLKASAFGGTSVDDATKAEFQMLPVQSVQNGFSITIDLFAGDEFQVIPDWSFDEQRGFGYLKDYDESCMECGYSTSGENGKANISVLADGNYTVTITTDPDNGAMDAIATVRNGDAKTAPEAVEETEQAALPAYAWTEKTGVKLKGSWVDDWSDLKDLERQGETAEYAITMDMEAGTSFGAEIFEDGADAGVFLASECVSEEASKAYIDTAEHNITVKDAGTYTITVNIEQMSITITKE